MRVKWNKRQSAKNRGGGKMRQLVRVDVIRDKQYERLFGKKFASQKLWWCKMSQFVRLVMKDKWNQRQSEINWLAKNRGGGKMRQLIRLDVMRDKME